MKLPEVKLFRERFVSLVFTPTKLQVVKLDKSKQASEVTAEKEIPPGIISGYRVKDTDTLVSAIKELWKKAKLSGKFVGVVVPEFATYTKSLELPNMTDSEVDEALSWQIQDFIPAQVDQVIMDWKMISRSEEKMELLVVAILKDVLTGYIDAVDKAGLSPLVVETPAISVERLSGPGDNGKIIIYVNHPEALLVLAQGQKIIASSVVTSSNRNIIVNTALQMISHYTESKVDIVLVSGPDLTQDLVQDLNNNLGRTVKLLETKVAGLDQHMIQNYLVGISLQHKNPVEPASQLTINLLPPQWADHYKIKHAGIKTWALTLVISIFSWTIFLAVLIVFTLVGLQAQSLALEADAQANSSANGVISEVQDINKLITKYQTITSGEAPFQAIFNDIASVDKEGVSINSQKINYETGEIVVVAVARDRDTLRSFKSIMEGKEEYGDINIPPLLSETNITFEMKTTYKQAISPKKQQIKLRI